MGLYYAYLLTLTYGIASQLPHAYLLTYTYGPVYMHTYSLMAARPLCVHTCSYLWDTSHRRQSDRPACLPVAYPPTKQPNHPACQQTEEKLIKQANKPAKVHEHTTYAL